MRLIVRGFAVLWVGVCVAVLATLAYSVFVAPNPTLAAALDEQGFLAVKTPLIRAVGGVVFGVVLFQVSRKSEPEAPATDQAGAVGRPLF